MLCSRADSEAKHQNFRQSSRSETGTRSPPRSGFALAFSLALLENQILRPHPRSFPRPLSRGRAPPLPNKATLNSVDLAEMEECRGCFLETARFYFFWFGHIHLPVSCCCDLSVSFFVVASFDISSLSISRFRGCDCFLPTASLGGSPLASSNPSALPRRDTSTETLQHQEHKTVFVQHDNKNSAS